MHVTTSSSVESLGGCRERPRFTRAAESTARNKHTCLHLSDRNTCSFQIQIIRRLSPSVTASAATLNQHAEEASLLQHCDGGLSRWEEVLRSATGGEGVGRA